jgi:Protein of unknown function (DUF3224).
MSLSARGRFEVQLTPQAFSHEGVDLNRLSIDKQFQGEIVGTSRGEMLSAMGTVEGSAGYVAIERFEGSLHGRRGSFVLQHFGMMDRGEQRLTVEIVPDSGEGELQGISGSLQILMENGEHYYELTYQLADQ